MTVGHGSTQESVTFPDSPASDSTSLVLPVQSDPQGKGKAWGFFYFVENYAKISFIQILFLVGVFSVKVFLCNLEVFISHNN